MSAVRLSLLAILWLVGACAPPPSPPGDAEAFPSLPEGVLTLHSACTRSQASQWAEQARTDGIAALKGANCFLYLAEQGDDAASQLADAQQGRRLAQYAAEQYPRSGLAHYLVAFLTGLEAERAPLRGLQLVPVIQRAAQKAAELEPELDAGGPDRLLGELYLRAPGFPVSIGDPGKAIDHFRLALTQAPASAENRIGLIEALLTEGNDGEACRELARHLREENHGPRDSTTWVRTMELVDRFCAGLEEN